MRIFATATFVVLAALAVQSATLSVPGDYSTIQLAIDAASSGDIVEVADGIYTGTGNTSIELRGKLMTVRSANGPEITIIDCQNAGRGFYIHEGETNASTIQGFTIRNGSTSDGGGGMRVQNASITAINCIFRNSVAHQGGAVYINTPPDNPSFIGCQFIGNEADVGGAVAGETGPGLVLTSCTIVDNLGLGGGSAVSLISSEPATIDRCILAFNRGNCAVVTSTTPHITCTDIFGNEGGDWIGGIEDQEFTNDNISRDPAFCAPETGNYSLRTYSPCTSTNSPCDSLVGALGTESCSIKVPVPTAISLGAEDMTHVLDHNPSIEWTYLDVPTSIQSAYEIEVGTDDDWTVAEMWATGQTSNSYESMTYSGSPLLDGETYFLRIRVHNGSDWGSWLKLSFRMNSVPTVPVPVSPIAGTTVYWSTVILTTDNSDEADGDALTYDFELYSDAGHTTLVAEFTDVVEQPGQTMVGPVAGLSSEDQYWWRVRADDGYEPAAWSTPQSFSTPAEGTLLVPEHFDAIQAAIDAAIEGDEILVGPGDYREHLTFGSKSVSLIATGGSAVTFVTAVDSGRHVVEFPTGLANASLLEGFTVRDAHNACGIVIGEGNSPTIRYCHMTNNAGLDGAGIMCLGSDVQIRGCQFTNNRCNATKNDEGAGVFVTGDNVTIDSCVFAHNNSNEGAAGAIYTRYSSGLVVSRNLAYDNSSLGQGGGFMYAYSALNITVINNTIVGNHTNVRGAGISLIGTNYVDIRNNIIAFNEGGPGIWSPWDGTVTVEYNNIYGNTVGDEDELTGGTGSISTDPLFTAPEVECYGLQSSSPCIDSGDPDPTYNDPDGSRNNMGTTVDDIDLPSTSHVSLNGEDIDHVVGHFPNLTWGYGDYPVSVQQAYEIEVGTDNNWPAAEMWATEQVMSGDQSAVYSGAPLVDGETYQTRIRVSNGGQWGSWRGFSFRMNSVPPAPILVSPIEGNSTDLLNTVLVLDNPEDLEGDSLVLEFEVYADPALTTLVVKLTEPENEDGQTTSQLVLQLEESTQYWWRARATDGRELTAWSSVETFTVATRNTIHVPQDQPTIQAAIDAADEGDIIEIADGVYTGTGNKEIEFRGRNLTLRSVNGPATTTIDCEGSGRAFFVHEGETGLSSIEGLTIRNGNSGYGGALFTYGVSLTVQDCVFDSNAGNSGGAVNVFSSRGVTSFVDCQFLNNQGLDLPYDYYQGLGGAVHISHSLSDVTFHNCIFSGNSADEGGAVYGYSLARIELSQCTMVGNHSYSRGAACYLKGVNATEINQCILTSNTGDLTIDGSYTKVIATCTNSFGNSDEDWGGALQNQLGLRSNFSQDPGFCWPEAGDFSLRSYSGCTAANSPCGTQIGALGSEFCSFVSPAALTLGLGSEELSRVVDHVPIVEWSYRDANPSTQVAYEVEVGTDDDWSAAEMWSSGQVVSSTEWAQYDGAPLLDGETYHVRARVSNGNQWGTWLETGFRMNLAPSVPTPAQPVADSIVAAYNVFLIVDNASDEDGDELSYEFEMYIDTSVAEPELAISNVDEQSAQTSTERIVGLATGIRFWWRARANDLYESSDWSPLHSFRVTTQATHRVPQEYSTIQAAIDAAIDGDIVEVSDGVYSGPGNRDIEFGGRLLTVRSVNGPTVTIIDCRWKGRGFHIHDGETNALCIDGFTIRNGYKSDPNDIYNGAAGGAMRIQDASATVRNCVLENSRASGGGALYINSPTDQPFFTSCQFLYNQAGWGGAVNIQHGDWSVPFTGCLFAGNEGNRGGALSCGLDMRFTLTNCTFTGNHAGCKGSVLKHGSVNPSSFTRCLLAFNACVPVIDAEDAPPHFSCTDIYGNEGGDWAGGIGDQENIRGNMSADPLFCNYSEANGQIGVNSPCAPANNSCQMLIGSVEPWCGFVCGDVNGDGEATPVDLLILIELYYGYNTDWPDSPGAVDMDCDGVITITDIILLSGYVYGYGPTPCCVEPPPPPPDPDPVERSANSEL